MASDASRCTAAPPIPEESAPPRSPRPKVAASSFAFDRGHASVHATAASAIRSDATPRRGSAPSSRVVAHAPHDPGARHAGGAGDVLNRTGTFASSGVTSRLDTDNAPEATLKTVPAAPWNPAVPHAPPLRPPPAATVTDGGHVSGDKSAIRPPPPPPPPSWSSPPSPPPARIAPLAPPPPPPPPPNPTLRSYPGSPALGVLRAFASTDPA